MGVLHHPFAAVLSLLAISGLVSGTTGSLHGYSPASRTIIPKSIAKTTGVVTTTANDTADVSVGFTLSGANASITFDFGQIVSGLPTFQILGSKCGGRDCETSELPTFTCSDNCQGLGLAYSETLRFAGAASDNSVFTDHEDGTLYVPMIVGSYTPELKYSRGAFRYLTFSLGSRVPLTTSATLQLSSVHFTAQPAQPANQLRSYSGYFESSDPLLDRIWYAGAYTLQLCTIPANSSLNRLQWLQSPVGWSNNAQARTLSGTDYFLADGAKRDRNPWAGDLDIALKSVLVAMNQDELLGIRNALKEMLDEQSNSTSFFPYGGSPISSLLAERVPSSDTYHLWTITAFCEYVFASGDVGFGLQYFPSIVRSLEATYQYVNTTTGLYSGTMTSDWGRIGQGGQNTALNAIYYRALNQAASLRTFLDTGDAAKAMEWISMIERVKMSANRLLYSTTAGMFFDNTTAAGQTLFPQDGNALAINFNLTIDSAQAAIIARNLAGRLTTYGAPAPEAPGAISPFMSGEELRAQFSANPGNAKPAVKLLRTMWGYMLETFSNTTMIEGYSTDGTLSYPFYPGDPSFVSLTHAWSTGPTYSLINDVVGIRGVPGVSVNQDEDGAWVFAPAVAGSGLSYARGGFRTHMGNFSAYWTTAKGRLLVANLAVPETVGQGTIYAPTFGQRREELQILLDGDEVSHTTGQLLGFARISAVPAGFHTLQVFQR